MAEPSPVVTALALWGAVLSSVTFGWNLYRDYIQRGRLRVHCFVGHIVRDPSTSAKKKWLIWRVTNIGKESVVLTNIGGNSGATSFVVDTREPLPVTLEPGEYFSSQTDDFSILDEKLKFLAAYDSLERTFKAPRRVVRELKRKHAAGEFKEK
jgi:hypothetical protein